MTSLLIPFLVVVLRIAREDEAPHTRLEPKDATKYVFAAMWTPVIMLLLGGFTIAAALSKYHIAKLMATYFLSKAGTKPRTVLLTNMFVAMIASMWISNVAAPVLCFSIVQVRYVPSQKLKSPTTRLTIYCAATPPQPPVRLPLLQSPHPRHRPRRQHRRRRLPHRISPKHHRPPKHGPSTQLAGLVLHRPPCLYNIHPSNLDPPPPHLPTGQRHQHRPHPPHDRPFHRRPILHLFCHHRHYRPVVRDAPTRRRFWRHGRCGYHPHGHVLRHRHPHQRGL